MTMGKVKEGAEAVNAGMQAAKVPFDIYAMYKSMEANEENMRRQQQAYNDALLQKQRENALIEEQNMYSKMYATANAGTEHEKSRGTLEEFYSKRGY